MSQPRPRPAAVLPVRLAEALNATLGLTLADSAEARAWLADGGWTRLDAWVEAHRTDPREAQPEENPE